MCGANAGVANKIAGGSLTLPGSASVCEKQRSFIAFLPCFGNFGDRGDRFTSGKTMRYFVLADYMAEEDVATIIDALTAEGLLP